MGMHPEQVEETRPDDGYPGAIAMKTNPYSSPRDDDQTVAYDGPIYFGGSLTEAEAEDFCYLRTRRGAPPISSLQLAVMGITAGLWVAHTAVQGIFYSAPELLIRLGLSVIVLGVVASIWYRKRSDRLALSQFKSNGEGVFVQIGGRVDSLGIEYLHGDYPIRYRWEDFAGCRFSNDVVVLLVEFPDNFNVISASLCQHRRAWSHIKQVITAAVPKLKRNGNDRVNDKSQRLKHVVAGVHALGEQKWQTALTEFDRARAFDATDVQIPKGRMVAAFGLGDLNETESAIAEVLTFGPADELTRRMRAKVYLQCSRFEVALDDLNWLIEHDQNDSDAFRDRGLVNLKLGNLDHALRDTTTATQLNGEDAVAFNNRGAILIELERFDEAVSDLQTAVRLAPDFERAKTLLNDAVRLRSEAAVRCSSN